MPSLPLSQRVLVVARTARALIRGERAVRHGAGHVAVELLQIRKATREGAFLNHVDVVPLSWILALKLLQGIQARLGLVNPHPRDAIRHRGSSLGARAFSSSLSPLERLPVPLDRLVSLLALASRLLAPPRLAELPSETYPQLAEQTPHVSTAG